MVFGLLMIFCGFVSAAGVDISSSEGESAPQSLLSAQSPPGTQEYVTELLLGTQDADIQRAIDLLKAGELVAVPSETVYGLGANAADPDAVMKIFQAKNRPLNHPFIIHIASFDDVSKWAKNISPRAKKLADAFWPGPLTMELFRADGVNMVVTGGHDKVALRCPADPVFSKILRLGNIGVAAPSANLHKKISTTTTDHVMKSLNGRIAAVVDGGPSAFGTESTIIDLKADVPRILRPGPITKEEIEAVLGEEIIGFQEHGEATPGNMKIHYQPATKATLMSLDAIKKYLVSNPQKSFAIVFYSELEGVPEHQSKLIKLSRDKRLYAHGMYSAMHYADELGCDQILIEEPPKTSEWEDVRDRLAKATAVL